MTTTKKFLRLPAVIEATGWSRATIWRKVKAGVLPAPIPIGPKSIAWDAEEIAQWQQRCIDTSRSGFGEFRDITDIEPRLPDQ